MQNPLWPSPCTDAHNFERGLQHVHYVDEMKDVLADLGNKLHVLSGTNTDSGRPVTPAAFDGIADFRVETDTLFDVLTECRVVRFGSRERRLSEGSVCNRGVHLRARLAGSSTVQSRVSRSRGTLQGAPAEPGSRRVVQLVVTRVEHGLQRNILPLKASRGVHAPPTNVWRCASISITTSLTEA